MQEIGGLWTTLEQLQQYLQQHSLKKEIIAALKLQIRYRKEILKQEVENKSLFRLCLPVESLQQHLQILIQLQSPVQLPTSNSALLVSSGSLPPATPTTQTVPYFLSSSIPDLSASAAWFQFLSQPQ